MMEWSYEIPPPFDTTWCKALVGFFIGICCGSFATMLSYRLPRKISIISPSSQCPSCSAQLMPRDLIPVFSWVLHGGKCRHCAAPIGARYIMIEIVTGILTALAFILGGFYPVTAIMTVAITGIVTIATIMMERR